jgi:hypothetical protein
MAATCNELHGSKAAVGHDVVASTPSLPSRNSTFVQPIEVVTIILSYCEHDMRYDALCGVNKQWLAAAQLVNNSTVRWYNYDAESKIDRNNNDEKNDSDDHNDNGVIHERGYHAQAILSFTLARRKYPRVVSYLDFPLTDIGSMLVYHPDLFTQNLIRSLSFVWLINCYPTIPRRTIEQLGRLLSQSVVSSTLSSPLVLRSIGMEVRTHMKSSSHIHGGDSNSSANNCDSNELSLIWDDFRAFTAALLSPYNPYATALKLTGPVSRNTALRLRDFPPPPGLREPSSSSSSSSLPPTIPAQQQTFVPWIYFNGSLPVRCPSRPMGHGWTYATICSCCGTKYPFCCRQRHFYFCDPDIGGCGAQNVSFFSPRFVSASFDKVVACWCSCLSRYVAIVIIDVLLAVPSRYLYWYVGHVPTNVPVVLYSFVAGN